MSFQQPAPGSASSPHQPQVASPNPYAVLVDQPSWADLVSTSFSSSSGPPADFSAGRPRSPLRFSTPLPSSSPQDQGRKQTRQEFSSPSTARPFTADAVPSSSSSSASP